MANYKATVISSKSIEEAFSYMADFRTAPEWDENTVSSELLTADPFLVGARYDVVTKFAGREMELTYEAAEIERPHRIVLKSGNGSTDIQDTMTFRETAEGTEVTYDANIAPHGLAKLLDPVLSLIFKRIGDKAVEGLKRELDAR